MQEAFRRIPVRKQRWKYWCSTALVKRSNAPWMERTKIMKRMGFRYYILYVYIYTVYIYGILMGLWFSMGLSWDFDGIVRGFWWDYNRSILTDSIYRSPWGNPTPISWRVFISDKDWSLWVIIHPKNNLLITGDHPQLGFAIGNAPLVISLNGVYGIGSTRLSTLDSLDSLDIHGCQTNEERLTARRDENQHHEKHAFAQAAFTCLRTLLTLEQQISENLDAQNYPCFPFWGPTKTLKTRRSKRPLQWLK